MEILAHQGGWDEMLMVLVPIAAIVLLLRMVRNKVADRRAGEAGELGDESGDQPDSTRSSSPPSDPNRPTTSS